MAEARYVRIRPAYLLRGWQGLPHALVDRQSGRAFFVREAVFQTLRFCTGGFRENSPVFHGVRRACLQELDRYGFLEYFDEPASLEPEQEYRFHDNRYLQLVLWSLTGHCNYLCRHCYMSAPHAVLPQPSTERCLDVADQLASCGIFRVALTGGEPLVRPDFLQIVDRILGHGMHIDVIMTNGALVDERLLDELDARGCRPEFSVSFDGPRRWHEWLRGVPGSYDDVCRALRLCRERGFPTGCNMVLHKGNLHSLREVARELGELGVGSLKVSRLSCIGEGTALGDYAITAKEEYEAYLEYIPHYVEDGMPVPVLKLADLFSASWGSFRVDAERNPEGRDCSGTTICVAARSSAFIGPDGRVLPCAALSEHAGTNELFPSLNQMTLAEALADPFRTEFLGTTLGDYRRHNPSCATCPYGNRCAGGCRACAVLANDGADLLGRDPDTCLLFRGGYYDRVQELIAALRPEQ